MQAPQPNRQTITLTFGPVAENQVGMEQIGEDVEHGFTPEELLRIHQMANQAGYPTEYYNLNEALTPGSLPEGVEAAPAALVVIRNGARMMMQDTREGPDDLWNEQLQLAPDTQYWDNRRQKVLNKQARYNLCFASFSQQADLDNKKGTIHSFDQLPHLSHVRTSLGYVLGEKAKDLNAEGNYYYNPSKCGIGFHGDGERKIVIAIRLGESMPLHYQWFYQSQPIGNRIRLRINHGDLYIMSEKATGYDWKRRVIPTLRHAAGADKYLKIKGVM